MMKKLISFIIAVFAVTTSSCAMDRVEVAYSEETELVSVLSRLAEVPGYVWDEQVLKSYLSDVDSCFARFKGHEAVRFVADSLCNDGFNWHFPVTLALHIQIRDGHVVLRDGIEKDFDGYYERITPERESELVRLLDNFYHDTNFHEFFVRNKALYDECCAAMRKVVDMIDFGWYDSFFGKRTDCSFKVYLGILIGPANYSVHIKNQNDTETVNAVMGCCGRDDKGNIYYGVEYTLPIILHECNHSYCNPLNAEYWEQIKDKASEIFSANSDFYASLAYGAPKLVMDETFVEACVIRYLQTHNIDLGGNPNAIEDWIKMDENDKKFVLIRPLVKLLKEREADTLSYPTMRDFMPRLIETVNAYSVRGYRTKGSCDK